MEKNKAKKIIIMIILTMFFLGIITVIGIYLGNEEFRVWSDKNILAKDIEENKLPIIDLTSTDNTKVFAYGSNVVTLENNNLSIYNKSANKIKDLNLTISNPIFQSEGDYLLVADEGGSKVYLIYNDTIQWEKDVDGEIARTTVNKNGEVGIVVTGTTYKSVIIMYDINGKENFKTFLSTTSATDISLSEDGKYLAFIEINTLGATITSKVKNISVSKAISTPSEAIVNTYDANSNVLFMKIKYNKNRITVLGDDGVYSFYNGNSEKIINLDNNISFIDINLDGYVASVKEESGKFDLNLTGVDNTKVNTYLINDTIKNIYCNDNITAIDIGNRVEFVNSSGWLAKKFNSNQNIKDIIIGKTVAVIVYKDRAEVISI